MGFFASKFSFFYTRINGPAMSDNHKNIVVTQQNAVRPPPTALGIGVEKPKFPEYAVYAKRLESFDTWPEYIPVKKEDLVEAGLVYTGVGDSVRCYYCGGELRQWEREDVPMEEHAMWYPKCPLIMLVKDQAYIERLTRGERQNEDGSQTQADSVSHASDDSSLDSVPALACIEMGYSRDIVKKSIDICVNQHGNTEYKAKDLLEVILDIEDEDSTAKTEIAADTARATTNAKDDKDIIDGPVICPRDSRIVKGQNYVKKLSRGERPKEDDAQTQVDSVSHASDDSSLDSVPALACIDMGYSRDIVKKSINICVNQHGNTEYKAKDLLEVILDIEDEDSTAKTENAADTARATTNAKDDEDLIGGKVN